ncbi:MAG: DUF4838 domain-containing protein [Clostridiales bacterium]|nr:DUF4838 domain-containing protein [Clostridiales bacterium]
MTSLRFLFCWLCVVLVLVTAGCRRTEPAPEPPAEKPAQETEAAVPDAAESDVITLVRGDESSRAVTDAAIALRKTLEAAGLTVDLKTDWYKRGEEMTRYPGEIQVGHTNRPESEELYARMAEAAEPLDCLIRAGEVNSIAATDESIMDAVSLFADEYLRQRTAGREDWEMQRVHEFPRKLLIGSTAYTTAQITAGSSEPEKYAASELRKYLGQVGIWEGDGAAFDLSIDRAVGTDGYVITPGEDGTVTICGGNGRGVIYGVYAFFEQYAGARYFMPGLETLGEGDIVVDREYALTPIFEMRQSDWQCGNGDVDWCVKNGINQRDIPKKQGGNIKYGGFVHTIAGLTGTSADRQPCFSDPEILEKTIASVRALLASDPSITIVSVSQNDNQNYCTCAKCRAIDAEEGSHMGSLLRFINAVAKDIEDDYPDVLIDTLAYQHTRQAPKITKPRDNVCIRLCSIECCFSHPLNDPDCPENKKFAEDIVEWSKICDRIYVWDYVTDFCYYVQTFPNFHVLRENMRFFAEHGVKGMYPEGNYQSEQSGEFGELRCYLLAKLMMDPMMSETEYGGCMDDFLEGYYGKGWQYLRAYIDWTTAEAAGAHMNIWNPPFSTIPREKYAAMEETFDGWWDKAEELAGDRLEAVRRSRLQWRYIKLMLHPDAQLGKAFLEEVKEQRIRWREGQELPENPDFAASPETWR